MKFILRRECDFERILLRESGAMLRSLTMNLIDTVAILGTGLLGASLARALKARGVAKNV